MILDGWGLSDETVGNAVKQASTPNFDRLMSDCPHTTLKASGEDVGLPDGQMGNSEVGHLNIGAGRVVYQELSRIDNAIKTGEVFDNEALSTVMKNSAENDKSLHFLGLLSDGGVHSHIRHLIGFLDMAKKLGVQKVYVHAFLDGRDTPPQSAPKYIQQIEEHMKNISLGEIASVSGRYYAMDRDKRWERIKLAYDVLTKGEGKTAISAEQAIQQSYADGENDEFVIPTVITKDGNPVATIKDGDNVIFFNFRPDRARQITRALIDKEFAGFERDRLNLHYVCLTQYDVTIKNVEVAFKPQTLDNTLGQWIASKGKKQLRIAETEKYAHVTFFFNGGVEEPNDNEDRSLIQSPKVATYDLKPEMSAYEVTDTLLSKLDTGEYDLVILNFANPDMVGHTGVIPAAIKAVETVDDCMGKVVDKILSMEGSAIITADHGNAEVMIDPITKEPMTAHTTNLVPCILIGKDDATLRDGGRLCDLAPTLLELMGEDKPNEMTGMSLIE